jgi:uncharacterized protein (TIRG00374 family)
MTALSDGLKKTRKWFSFALTLLVLWAIAHYTAGHWHEFQVLKRVKAADILLMFAVYLAATAVFATRMLMVMESYGLEGMTYAKWLRIFLLARFFNRFIPQGGNLYRALALKKNYGFSIKRYATSFIVFTWVELVINLTLICLFFLFFKPGFAIKGIPALPVTAGITAALLVIPYVLYRAFKIIRKKQRGKKSKTAELFAKIESLAQTVRYFWEPVFLAKFTVLCLLSFGLVMLWFFLGFRSIGMAPGIEVLAIFTIILRVGLMVSITPGNIGLIELAYAYLTSALGYPFGSGIIVGALTRSVSFFAILLLGALWGGIPLLKSSKKWKDGNQGEP